LAAQIQRRARAQSAASELKARVETIQDRTKALMLRAEDTVIALIMEIQQAQEKGKSANELKAAQELQRKAQWRGEAIFLKLKDRFGKKRLAMTSGYN